MVNIEIMNCVFMNEAAFSEQWTSTIDSISGNIRHLFFYSKFFPVFSFLFGLGISMQALKSLEKRNAPAHFFLRRMAILFLFGLLHILLFWSGNVLYLYAILGLLCIPLLRILLIAICVFALQLAFSMLWLHHFYYGPLEWAWRCLSYRKLLPLKKEAVPGAKLA